MYTLTEQQQKMLSYINSNNQVSFLLEPITGSTVLTAYIILTRAQMGLRTLIASTFTEARSVYNQLEGCVQFFGDLEYQRTVTQRGTTVTILKNKDVMCSFLKVDETPHEYDYAKLKLSSIESDTLLITLNTAANIVNHSDANVIQMWSEAKVSPDTLQDLKYDYRISTDSVLFLAGHESYVKACDKHRELMSKRAKQ